MLDFQVRKASGRDADGILACLRAAFEKYHDQYTPEAFADTVLAPETIHVRLRDMQVLVAVSDGSIVGTVGCAISQKEGHLRGMAVHPDFQGTEVALALLHAAEDDLRRNGCVLVTLDTTAPLERAARFYEKHGFLASGRVSDFFGMPLYEYSKSLLDSRRQG